MELNKIISSTATIKSNVLIGNNVTIEDDCYIDTGAIIRDNVHIKKGSYIGANCIIGEYLVDFFENRASNNHNCTIGQNSIIRSGTIIYGDNCLGDYLQTGHRVTIRENSRIGEHVRIGTLSDIQGFCTISDYVNLHSNVHIGQHSFVDKYAWIFPYVVLTNDPTPPSNFLKGVHVDKFAVIATGSILLPGVKIGEDSLVGAGSIVTKDVAPLRIVVGNPAKDIGEVTKIKNQEADGAKYPWRYTFDRGMPWEKIGIKEWELNNGDN